MISIHDFLIQKFDNSIERLPLKIEFAAIAKLVFQSLSTPSHHREAKLVYWVSRDVCVCATGSFKYTFNFVTQASNRIAASI